MPTKRPKSHAVSNLKGSASAADERLTRTVVARRLAVSPASVIRMADRGELHPTRDAKGVYIFDVAEVTRVAQERSRRAVDPTKEGERDARAFELLDAGHDLRHLVTTLRISADVAKRIVNAWREAGQSDVVVPRACKVELEQCLGHFRDATELVRRARAAETANERVNEDLMHLQTRVHNLAVFVGELAARNPAVAEVVPEVRERLDSELAQVLDRAFECGTAQLVSAPPAAPIVPGAEEPESRNTVASAADGDAAARAEPGPTIEVTGARASSDATSASDTSSTKPSVNDNSVGQAVVCESAAAVPRGCESVGDPVSGRRAVDGQCGPDGAGSGIGVAGGGVASRARGVLSPREQLLDAWLESLTADDARLHRLAALLRRDELEMFAELERGIGIEVAATTGSHSRREHLADTLIVSLTEDDARLDQLGAMLTASELDMLARLGRGLAESETAAAMDEAASPT